MTPEQRFEQIENKLQTVGVRLESITETVQLIFEMQRDTEKRFAENERRFAENEKRFAENEERFRETGRQLDLLVRTIEAGHESIKALERIAVAHEQRLDDIEGIN